MITNVEVLPSRVQRQLHARLCRGPPLSDRCGTQHLSRAGTAMAADDMSSNLSSPRPAHGQQIAPSSHR